MTRVTRCDRCGRIGDEFVTRVMVWVRIVPGTNDASTVTNNNHDLCDDCARVVADALTGPEQRTAKAVRYAESNVGKDHPAPCGCCALCPSCVCDTCRYNK